MQENLKKIIQRINQQDSFVITAHENPDGDSLGSLLALTLALQKIGKNAVPCVPDNIPEKYTFLPGCEKIRKTVPADVKGDLIVLDCNELMRTGEYLDMVSARFPVKINIDHHQGKSDFADLDYHDPEACATGELVAILLKEMGVELDKQIATNLYAAITTDTGSFAYKSTRPLTHKIAADLLATGIDQSEISEKVFQMRSFAELRLIGQSLMHLEKGWNGKAAWISLTDEMIYYNGMELDTEGIVNYARYIYGVEIGILFKQIDDRKVKVSFRTSQNIRADLLAGLFQGGGHKQAAGCTVSGSLEKVKEAVLCEVGKLLDGFA